MLGSAALAPAASAEVLSLSQNGDISLPAGGNGSPYPSKIVVSGADGAVTDVNVGVTLSHTWPEDVDIALVSPDGDEVIVMSDVCGSSSVSEVTFTFTDEAGAPLAGGPCSAGSFKPSNVGLGDNFAGGPGVVESSALSDFDNENPNGTWELYALDDDGIGDSGTILNWSLTITTATAELIIPGTGSAGKARAYPSTETFNTPPGRVISDVNVSTVDVNHTYPDDIDMLLAGPRRGATSILMSDACGSEEIRHYIWTFDDEAGALMTNNALLPGCDPFVVKPSDFETGDVFPAPAPSGPYAASLAAFDGLEGGVFSLFAVDDVGSDSGYISNWSLGVTTRDAADTGFALGSVRVEEGGTASLEVKRSGPASLGPATVNVSTEGAATPGADFSAPTTVEFARGQASATVAIPIVNDKVGEAIESFRVVLSGPRDDARLVGTTATEVAIGPDNEFKFGKLRKNAEKGTAVQFVKVPGPGKLVLTSKKAKRVKKTVKKAGKVGLPVKPRGGALADLADDGSAKLGVKVTFTPVGGKGLSLPRGLKLVLND